MVQASENDVPAGLAKSVHQCRRRDVGLPKGIQPINELAFGTIAEIRAALVARRITPVEVVQATLERIKRDEPKIKAWVEIDEEGALAAARAVDVDAQPLGGIPFGVKDVIDVRGLPTRFGTQWDGFEPVPYDAWCVAAVRAAGAIPIGKLQTTTYAFSDPTPTRNPWNTDRSPGGSSSGSGAAVGARQVPFAFGTQTGGSTLRPAAFCGAVGLKATVGAIPTAGVSQLVPTMDCVGIICRDAADAATLFALIDPSVTRTEVPETPRIIAAEGFQEDLAGPDVLAAVRNALIRLAAAGAQVEGRTVPDGIHDVERAWAILGAYEAHAALGGILANRSAAPKIDGLVANGAKVSAQQYRDEQILRLKNRDEIDALLAGCDVVALPTASPVPPAGTMGNAVFLRAWTYFGYPAISLPVGFDSDGMPIGMQLVAKRGDDALLLALAVWAERAMQIQNPGPRSRLD